MGQRKLDRTNDAFDTFEHVLVRKVNHPVAERSQMDIATNVASGISFMREPVELYDEFLRTAEKVREVRSNLHLTGEAVAELFAR